MQLMPGAQDNLSLSDWRGSAPDFDPVPQSPSLSGYLFFARS